MARGRHLSDETWCGGVQVTEPAVNVADVDCVACLDAIIRAGIAARRRKAQLASNAAR